MLQLSHPGETNKAWEEGCPLVLGIKNAEFRASSGVCPKDESSCPVLSHCSRCLRALGRRAGSVLMGAPH